MANLGYQVFLSDPGSVRVGGVYFCGLKPYGQPGRVYPAPAPLPQGFNAYRDAPTGSPFYPRALRLIRHGLGLTLGPAAPPEAALCTNWFFQRAADTKQLKAFGLDTLDVSAIHRQLLSEYQPKLILCVGNGPVSSYRGMLDLYGLSTSVEVRYRGNSRLRAAATEDTRIIGVPHLSRYPVTDELLAFIVEA